jgi:hypothetical protein
MVLLMYWENETEEKRKIRREERLRAKKLGLPEPQHDEPPSTSDASTEKILEILVKQTEMSADQGKKIDQLSHIILEQQKLIDKIGEHKDQGVTREIIREVSTGTKVVEDKQEEKFTRLEDIDVNIIDTSGIETVGEVTGQVTKGDSIKNQLAKLKELRNKEN